MSENQIQTTAEEITNAVLHGIGLGLAIAALVILIIFASLYGSTWHLVGFSIYGITLIFLYLPPPSIIVSLRGNGKRHCE